MSRLSKEANQAAIAISDRHVARGSTGSGEAMVAAHFKLLWMAFEEVLTAEQRERVSDLLQREASK